MGDVLGTTLNSLPAHIWDILSQAPWMHPGSPFNRGAGFIDQRKAYNEDQLQPGDHMFDEGQYGSNAEAAKERGFVDRFTQQRLDQMFNERMDAYDAQNTVNEFKGGLPIVARRGRDI